MDKQSTLYQLMGMRMNGIMNRIAERDEDYQALLWEVDVYNMISLVNYFYLLFFKILCAIIQFGKKKPQTERRLLSYA